MILQGQWRKVRFISEGVQAPHPTTSPGWQLLPMLGSQEPTGCQPHVGGDGFAGTEQLFELIPVAGSSQARFQALWVPAGIFLCTLPSSINCEGMFAPVPQLVRLSVRLPD